MVKTKCDENFAHTQKYRSNNNQTMFERYFFVTKTAIPALAPRNCKPSTPPVDDDSISRH